MIVCNDRQKRYFQSKGILGYKIDVVRYKDVEAFLEAKVDRWPSVPLPLQMELYFGEDFNFWWYDDEGNLHPNDTDSLISDLSYEDDYDPYDDDIPF